MRLENILPVSIALWEREKSLQLSFVIRKGSEKGEIPQTTPYHTTFYSNGNQFYLNSIAGKLEIPVYKRGHFIPASFKVYFKKLPFYARCYRAFASYKRYWREQTSKQIRALAWTETNNKANRQLACSAGLFWAGESWLFMFALL